MKPEINIIRKTSPPFLQWTEFKFIVPLITENRFNEFKLKLKENSKFKISRVSLFDFFHLFARKILLTTLIGLMLGIIGLIIDSANNNQSNIFESLIGGVIFVFFLKLIRGGIKSIMSFIYVTLLYNLHFKTLELRIKTTKNYEAFLSNKTIKKSNC